MENGISGKFTNRRLIGMKAPTPVAINFAALEKLSVGVLASAKFIVQIPVLFEWLVNDPVKIIIDRPVGRLITL